MKVAIIGGGISGLSTAFFLKEAGFEIQIYEASGRVGGWLGTIQEHGFTVETAANGMLANEPATLDLIDALKLGPRILESSPTARRRYIFSGGNLREVPTRPGLFFSSSLMSVSGKLKALAEPLRRKRFKEQTARVSNDESVAAFGERHFGKEFAERILTPATIGICAGRANELILDLAFPKLRRIERYFGSVILGMIQSGKVARRYRKNRESFPRLKSNSLFSFKNGVQELISALHVQLEDKICLNWSANIFRRSDGRWQIGADLFDHVILTTAPTTWSSLFSEDQLPIQLAQKLSNFPAGPAMSLTFAFDRRLAFEGFGVLVDQKNYDGCVLGVLHAPDIFKNRAPLGCDLYTLIIGGSFKPEALNDREATIKKALIELGTILNTEIPKPIHTWSFAHAPGIPQYTVEAKEVQQSVEDWLCGQPGLWMNTNACGGVAVNDCIRKGKILTEVLSRSTMGSKKEVPIE